jgi:hypothetical protein
VLARYGDLAPGTGGARIQTAFQSMSHQSSALNGSGMACFQVALVGGDVVGSTNNSAWLVGVPGALQYLQRKGDLELGGTVGIGALGFNCMLNRSGDVLHDESLSTTLGSSPATAANNSIVFVWSPGLGNQVLVREGDPAVGLPAGCYYGAPTLGQAFSPSGVASFVSTLSGPGVTAGVDDQALFVGRVGSLAIAARRGDVAPGTGGLTFATINNGHASNDAGQVCFFATLAGAGVTSANDSSLWCGSPGDLRLIAREGDAAPGIAGGVFASVVAGSCLLNERGQVVFTGASVQTSIALLSAAYGFDPITGLQLLAAQGDTIVTASGPQTASGFGGGQFPTGDGCPLSLNNHGDLFLRTSLASGSAIVRGHLGSLTAVPASLSAALGGSQLFTIDAGSAHAGEIYLLAGGMSGTRPGFAFGGMHVPLVPDAWLNLSISNANTPVYSNTLGLLDGQGRASAAFNFPAGYPAFAGSTFHHVVVALDGGGNVKLVSEPASLLLH